MKDKAFFGITLAIILFLMGIIVVQSMNRVALVSRVSDLKTDLKISQGHREVNWNNYKACQGELEKCKERKPLAERFKNMTLQDFLADAQEVDQMVKAFAKKRGK